MDLTTALKDWLVPLSMAGALITASISGWLSLREYRLKLQAERRLAQIAEVEADINLLKLFTEIMDIAHARRGYSDKLLEGVMTPEMIEKLRIDPRLKTLLQDLIVPFPVGKAAQDSAIAAIGVLGKKHAVLRPIALQALQSLASFKNPVAQPFLDDLQNSV
jgi:hypothetical protein